MKTVLITRPAEAAASFARALEQRGYKPVIEPLLAIEPQETPQPEGLIDAVMITSANALTVAKGKIRKLLALPCYCVGARTAEKARAAGFTDVRPSDGDGTALALFITSDLESGKTNILHITGRHNDEGATQLLGSQGRNVKIWPVYDALAAEQLSPAAHILLADGKIDAVTVFSARTGEILVRLLQKEALEACCGQLAAICLSDAVAESLKPLGWRRLAAAKRPTEEDVIACLDLFAR